jgi:hypothetical protein
MPCTVLAKAPRRAAGRLRYAPTASRPPLACPGVPPSDVRSGATVPLGGASGAAYRRPRTPRLAGPPRFYAPLRRASTPSPNATSSAPAARPPGASRPFQCASRSARKGKALVASWPPGGVRAGPVKVRASCASVKRSAAVSTAAGQLQLEAAQLSLLDPPGPPRPPPQEVTRKREVKVVVKRSARAAGGGRAITRMRMDKTSPPAARAGVIQLVRPPLPSTFDRGGRPAANGRANDADKNRRMDDRRRPPAALFWLQGPRPASMPAARLLAFVRPHAREVLATSADGFVAASCRLWGSLASMPLQAGVHAGPSSLARASIPPTRLPAPHERYDSPQHGERHHHFPD